MNNYGTHSCIHASIHSCIHASMRPFIQPYIHPYIHSCIHPSVHPSIHLYEYTTHTCYAYRIQHLLRRVRKPPGRSRTARRPQPPAARGAARRRLRPRRPKKTFGQYATPTPTPHPTPTPTPANLCTTILDFRGFDSNIILILRGGILMSIGDFQQVLSQGVVAGIILVGRFGVVVFSSR